jgi:hypothetical protein
MLRSKTLSSTKGAAPAALSQGLFIVTHRAKW